MQTTKEDARAPTVALEALILSWIIDAMEMCNIATIDIPGALMQADMDEEVVHLQLYGKMAELLVQLDPKLYLKYIQIIKDKPILYVKLWKALYGTLRTAYLFWKRLSDQLMKWGFVLNPYDSCVANELIGEKQCTILWQLMISRSHTKTKKLLTMSSTCWNCSLESNHHLQRPGENMTT